MNKYSSLDFRRLLEAYDAAKAEGDQESMVSIWNEIQYRRQYRS